MICYQQAYLHGFHHDLRSPDSRNVVIFPQFLYIVVYLVVQRCILKGVSFIHQQGFGHRDIRRPNTLKIAPNHWMVSDLQSAKPFNNETKVDFIQQDLLGVAKLFHGATIPEAASFLSQLKHGQFTSAEEALNHPWFQSS